LEPQVLSSLRFELISSATADLYVVTVRDAVVAAEGGTPQILTEFPTG